MTYTVIVAEDEELLLTNLVQKIQKADPDFLVAGTAQTGDQALALIEKLSPDLVITDIRMPVMGGLEAARQIRTMELPEAKQVPIIPMTAQSSEESKEGGRTAGMNSHLTKPIEPDSLVQTILETTEHAFGK